MRAQLPAVSAPSPSPHRASTHHKKGLLAFLPPFNQTNMATHDLFKAPFFLNQMLHTFPYCQLQYLVWILCEETSGYV